METFFNRVGLGLLLAAFLVSAGRVFLPVSSGEGEGGKTVIRVAHWQLEGGVRQAFDQIAEAYSRLHPGVKVEQVLIPERIYMNWLTAQLVGSTAPDIVELRPDLSDERLARFFHPLTEMAALPNPYNRGTNLESIPLRETFFDGMESGYSKTLLEYYSVPISGFTLRMFYNLDLLEKISGKRELPRTFEEFVALCSRAQSYALETGRPIIPIAGSKYNGPILMKNLFASQNQRLAERLGVPEIPDPADYPDLLGRKYLDGAWSLRDAEIQSGLSLMEELGRNMQSGFMQLQRDDAMFYFVQGNALMICSGSWDATSIRLQSPFALGVSALPFPDSQDSRYGRFSSGAPSEGAANAGLTFGLSRSTTQREVAMDFLRFLTSQGMNQVWTDVSGWIPAVTGVKPPSEAEPFQPILKGGMPGFFPSFSGADGARVTDSFLHELWDSDGGVPGFTDAVEDEYRAAIVSDMRRREDSLRDNARRSDVILGVLAWRSLANPESSESAAKLDRLLQAVGSNERALSSASRTVEIANGKNP